MTETKGFVHTRTVRFGECDPAGVAYYPTFFNWFHQAMEACFEEWVGTPYATIIQKTGFPAVQTSADFHRPLSVGSVIDVVVQIATIGRSSVEWRFDIYRRIPGKSSVLSATGKVKTVCIAVDDGHFAFASVPVPEMVRSRLEGLLIEP